MAASTIQTFDGVAFLVRGDLALIVYQAAARLHRTRWLFDRIDEALPRAKSGLVALMIVLPTADPPDGPTRQENAARMKKVGAALRCLVTVPVGDAFRISVVRTVMRGLAILQGQRRRHLVCETIHEGIRRTLEAAGPDTPPRAEIVEDLQALHAALGVPMPEFDTRARIKSA